MQPPGESLSQSLPLPGPADPPELSDSHRAASANGGTAKPAGQRAARMEVGGTLLGPFSNGFVQHQLSNPMHLPLPLPWRVMLKSRWGDLACLEECSCKWANNFRVASVNGHTAMEFFLAFCGKEPNSNPNATEYKADCKASPGSCHLRGTSICYVSNWITRGRGAFLRETFQIYKRHVIFF